MKKKKLKSGLSSVKDSTWLDSVLKQGLSEAPNVKWPKAIHFEDGGGAGGDAGGADAGSSDGGDNDSGGNEPPSPFSSYDLARDYFSTRQNWDATSLAGLSSREPFNFNALWGGTQYAQGRVTDWSHLDQTQYQSNYIASNTRNELWNEYEALKAQGKTPAKNPDEVALDFYVKNVGQNGNTFGYGPGANTAMINEAIKHQFLNSPDVVQATGTTYQTPQEKLSQIEQFGAAHQSGVPTWQVFEQQQYGGKDWLGSLIPMIIGGMAFGPLSAGLTSTFGALAPAIAGGLIGGTTAEIGGGDFMKGALTGGVGAGLAGGLSGVSSSLVESGLSPTIADAVTKAAATAVRAGISGGDVEQAILGSLVNSGVGGAVSEGIAGADIPQDLVKTISNIATPVISTAIQGGDVETALTNSLIKGGLSLAKDASWGVNEQPSQDIGDMIGSETARDIDDAEIGAGIDLTGGTGKPIQTESVPSTYEGLEGYTPEVIQQLYDGTYAGPEAPSSETDTLLRDILGDEVVDQLYPEGLPTSSSAYEGLGYDANTINQLMEGPSATLNEDGTYTYGGYSGPEQTEAEVREQMGDELFALAYPQGYGTTLYGSQTSGGGSAGTSGGAAGTSGGAAGSSAYSGTLPGYQSAQNAQQNAALNPLGYLPGISLSTGKYEQPNVVDYAQIIPKLANVLAQKGYKFGGSVSPSSEYVPGPEGKLYERHEIRGFAVGGPGTGQSDDIPTMLSDGEYVIDADTVAALGDGSSKAGAEILDKFRQEIRSHKRSAPTDRIPPKAKNPLVYLKSAKKSKG